MSIWISISLFLFIKRTHRYAGKLLYECFHVLHRCVSQFSCNQGTCLYRPYYQVTGLSLGIVLGSMSSTVHSGQENNYILRDRSPRADHEFVRNLLRNTTIIIIFRWCWQSKLPFFSFSRNSPSITTHVINKRKMIAGLVVINTIFSNIMHFLWIYCTSTNP